MKNTKEKILLSSPHMSGIEQKYIQEAFDSNWIAPLGPNVDSFEKGIADYCKVEGAAAVSSGTAALHLALKLLNVQEGDKVFCSSLTFVASANPILYQGAEPVFIDSEWDTWNMSPEALGKALEDAHSQGELPKAVIVVNLYGQSAKMNEIVSICNRYSVPIIEDAAESLGSTYHGKPSGTFGQFGVFSFNGNKIITTSGGGMLISNNVKSIKKARVLATQSRDPALHYQHSQIGYNYRMSNILAGIGRAQLEVLESRVEARRSIFHRYFKELSGLPGIKFMPELKASRSNRWLTALTIDEKESGISSEALIEALIAENIEARPVWKPMHLQPLFEKYRFYTHSKNEDVSRSLFYNGICLPSGSNMSEEDQSRVINIISKSIISKLHV